MTTPYDLVLYPFHVNLEVGSFPASGRQCPFAEAGTFTSAHISPTLSCMSKPWSDNTKSPGNNLSRIPQFSLMCLSLISPSHGFGNERNWTQRCNTNTVLHNCTVFGIGMGLSLSFKIWWSLCEYLEAVRNNSNTIPEGLYKRMGDGCIPGIPPWPVNQWTDTCMQNIYGVSKGFGNSCFFYTNDVGNGLYWGISNLRFIRVMKRFWKVERTSLLCVTYRSTQPIGDPWELQSAGVQCSASLWRCHPSGNVLHFFSGLVHISGPCSLPAAGWFHSTDSDRSHFLSSVPGQLFWCRCFHCGSGKDFSFV